MTDIIKIDETNVAAFVSSKGGFLDVGKPFSKQIFLVDCHIAGTSYIENIDDLEPSLLIDKKLYFYREPENPHDELAIVIRDEKGNKLGYVPRDKNEILSRLMDAGKLIYGIIYEKQYIDEWLEVTIQIFMDD